MANIKSQIKRIGTNKKAQERNKAVKSELKTAIRSTREAIAAGDTAKAQAALVVSSSSVGATVSRGRMAAPMVAALLPSAFDGVAVDTCPDSARGGHR